MDSNSEEDFIIDSIEDVSLNQKTDVGEASNFYEKNTGAKKKNPSPSFSHALTSNLSTNPFVNNVDFSQFSNYQKNEHLPENFESTVNLINQGLRVCVIMRGAPGSGKSWLANKIVDMTVKKSYRNYVFSADDFFMDPDGNYKYDNFKISQAHEYNQSRFRKHAKEGWSPLIVDNTNSKIWEMVFYVQTALENNYHVEIMEPNTPWKKSAGQLQKKNSHGVTADKIKIKIDTYEKATVDSILKSYNLLHLKKKRVTMRHYPEKKLKFTTTESLTTEVPHNWNDDSWIKIDKKNDRVTKENLLPKPTVQHIEDIDFDTWKLEEPPKIPDEPLFEGSWTEPAGSDEKLTKSQKNVVEKSSFPQPQRSNAKKKNDSKLKMSPHRRDCPMIDPNFALLCEMYPQINDRYLWDLFVKAKGDIEWTVNILLEDNSMENATNCVNELSCLCFTSDYTEMPSEIPNFDKIQENHVAVKNNHNQRSNKKNSSSVKTVSNEEFWNIKKDLEEKVHINQDSYPEHVRKVKMWKQGVFDFVEQNSADSDFKPLLDDDELAVDSDDTDYADTNELTEIELSKEFIKQLDNCFGGDSFKQEIESNTSKIPTKIFMPKKIGQELYALWLETLYSKQEEEKIKCCKDDEELARQIHQQENPAKDKVPETLEEIMDMESALDSYHKEVKAQIEGAQRNDWATKMTKEKLLELFPSIQEDSLLEIYTALDNNFTETVKILQDSLPEAWEAKMQNNTKNLIEKTKVEIAQETNKTTSPITKRLEKEDRNIVLQKLEDVRESLEFHRESKKSCMEKAKEAIQQGKYSTANYYTNMSNLHRLKIDEYNLIAASCTQRIHETIQFNQNILDLHFFKSIEAVQCLDIFLDKHINRLRAKKIPYKEVFIITGRGLHSIGGVPSIKNKTMVRLRDRRLRAVQENPGLLKVKIFHQSALLCECPNLHETRY